MRDRGGGSIIGMSSGAGHFPHRWLWAYGASKAGVEEVPLRRRGVRRRRHPRQRPATGDHRRRADGTDHRRGKLLDHYLANMPLGRVGTVNDVAEAVRFLAGPESSWITGACLPIDGGHHLRSGADYSLLFR